MTVYISGKDIPRFDEDIPESDETLIPCELLAVTDNGLDLKADTWTMSGFGGVVYDAEGSAITPTALAVSLLQEQAQAIMDKLTGSGVMAKYDRVARLFDRLLDLLEAVPLLSAIIKRLREEDET